MALISDMGLVSRGIDEATERKNKLALQAQDVATGNMGLAERQRAATEESNVRSAVQQTPTSGGMYGATLAKAEQLRASGNLEGYKAAYAEADKLLEQSRSTMARAATSGQPPAQLERHLTTILGSDSVAPGSISYGKLPNGNTVIKFKDAKTGNDAFFDATDYINASTPIEKYKEGESGWKGTKKVIDVKKPASLVTIPKEGSLYDPDTKKIVASNKPKQEGVGGFSKEDLPVTKEIGDIVFSQPGMADFDPATGKPTPTEIGSRKAVLANQLYIGSGKSIAPALSAEIATRGTPRYNNATGERWVEYGGKKYKWSLPGETASQPVRGAQPAAAPASPVTPAAQPQQPRAIKEIQAEINSLSSQPSYIGMDLKAREDRINALKNEARMAMQRS